MGLLDPIYRWSDATVPYTIDDSAYTGFDIYIIRLAMIEIQEISCIKFVPHSDEPNFIQIRVR